MEFVRMLLVDDNPQFLEATIRFLSSFPDIHVIGNYHSAREAINQIDILNPDLILMDFALPDMNGVEATRLIKTKANSPRVIILTLYDNPEYRKASEAAYADGFVSKSDLGIELLPMINDLFQKVQPIIE